MWRTITRFRQSVTAFTRFNNDSAHNPHQHPGNVSPDKRWLWSKGCWQSQKCCCGSWSRNGEEHRDHRARHGGPYFQAKHDWLDAFGWSGVILISWYICQPLCTRRFSRDPALRYAYQRLEKATPSDYPNLVNLISKLILESPAKYVLPTVQAVKSKTSSPGDSEQSQSIRALCESLETAHEKVTRSLQNFLGTECMQAGKHDKAFAHFSEAAKFDDAPALFNLAICHELGLGTQQCFIKAADLYKRAAALGHATAMYNLGVFHVHGWGGVDVDEDLARKLFTDAANLGQIDAKRALSNDEEFSCDEDDDDEEEYQFPYRDIEPRTNDLTTLWYKAFNINLGRVDIGDKHYERLSSADSGVNDLFSSELDVAGSPQ